MRNLIYIFVSSVFLSMLFFSCGNNSKKTGNGDFIFSNPVTADNFEDTTLFFDTPTFQLKETEYNFGVVIEGEKVSHTYIFKNIGKSNLLISNIKPSCGCTSPKWTKEPIKPGEEGYIELSFDSGGRVGHQRKTAIVYANTQPNETEIAFQCDVVNN